MRVTYFFFFLILTIFADMQAKTKQIFRSPASQYKRNLWSSACQCTGRKVNYGRGGELA